MAAGQASVTGAAYQRFSALPALRQLGLLIGLSASIALGVAVALWSQDPSYRPLYHSLETRDLANVVDSLEKLQIPHKVDHLSGSVLVANDQVHKARLTLAKEGLPQGAGHGFELLDKKVGLGTSQFMERARYRNALSGELARTITSFKNVRSARVHLAIPKQSAFLHNRRKATASVLVDMFSGRMLEKSQILSITHLVASSIPNLRSQDVTVVDQSGQLLSQPGMMEELMVANRQLSYIEELEKGYSKQINHLLTPILGAGKFRAEVDAAVDFTHVEQTSEEFSPKTRTLRSEQSVSEQRSGSGALGGGVAGALSNQPGGDGEGAGGAGASEQRNQSVRNMK